MQKCSYMTSDRDDDTTGGLDRLNSVLTWHGTDRTTPQLDVTCFHIAHMRHSIRKMQLDFSQLQLDVSPQPD
ncbi:BZ3500_MvSof-1268-A1-R1_C044g00120 [Microbotryum saponariae]|uniref:BZ3500_MvSof-1268-A1-R1_C039g00072 protein n=1 Tax=Microbotryum saponariae TaxID=289078 RepID=A0A2X0LAT5_9BASI|nr:BZ3500_MvSof-1268-A1-R1_C039g00072 [Microbotryum saponariae]SDA04155.1 BZ3500_MvSof-1268-A1-R1_C044g00120 [Microbotryum saponariae]SDA07229.1 BZ3501_MvSof-1269-A2-R1_Chr4-3g07276 [Microbotryum saponariae]